MAKFYDMERRRHTCRHKLDRCVRFARECNHDWLNTGRRAFRQLRNEAMQDARYWKEEPLSGKRNE